MFSNFRTSWRSPWASPEERRATTKLGWDDVSSLSDVWFTFLLSVGISFWPFLDVHHALFIAKKDKKLLFLVLFIFLFKLFVFVLLMLSCCFSHSFLFSVPPLASWTSNLTNRLTSSSFEQRLWNPSSMEYDEQLDPFLNLLHEWLKGWSEWVNSQAELILRWACTIHMEFGNRRTSFCCLFRLLHQWFIDGVVRCDRQIESLCFSERFCMNCDSQTSDLTRFLWCCWFFMAMFLTQCRFQRLCFPYSSNKKTQHDNILVFKRTRKSNQETRNKKMREQVRNEQKRMNWEEEAKERNEARGGKDCCCVDLKEQNQTPSNKGWEAWTNPCEKGKRKTKKRKGRARRKEERKRKSKKTTPSEGERDKENKEKKREGLRLNLISTTVFEKEKAKKKLWRGKGKWNGSKR